MKSKKEWIVLDVSKTKRKQKDAINLNEGGHPLWSGTNGRLKESVKDSGVTRRYESFWQSQEIIIIEKQYILKKRKVVKDTGMSVE